MQPDSETEFLNPILVTYGYNPNDTEILARLCQEKHMVFLEICHELFKAVILSFLRSAHRLPDGVLETIASDLSKILAIWEIRTYTKLVDWVYEARNQASRACGKKNEQTRYKSMNECRKALTNAYDEL